VNPGENYSKDESINNGTFYNEPDVLRQLNNLMPGQDAE
jgi:hypothetical protein